MAQFRLSRFDDSGDEEQPTFSTNTLQGSGGAIKQSTVLEAAKAVDFSKPDQSVAFEKKYREFLNTANNERTSTSGNILHKLADKSEDDWWQDKHEGEAGDGRSFLRWLLKNYEHMLKCEYKKDDSIPLHFALYHENHAFVKIALDGLEPEDSEIAPSSTLGQILQHRNRDDETCLYLAVKHNSEHVNRIIKLCARIGNEAGGVRRSNVFAQQSLADKSTALHHAVMLRQEETLAINFVTDPPLATIVNESMKADMRLELISLQVVNKSPVDEKRLEMVKLLMESEFIQNTASNVRAILARMNYSEDKDKKHNKALNLTPFQTRVEGLVSRIWKAYRAHAMTEFRGLPGPIKDKLKKTAREQALQTALAEVYGTDEILTMMKLFCIDKFRTNRKNLLQALYAPGEERHLEFSLSGLRGQTLTKDYLKRLVKHLKFESILICVSLPSLIFETDPVENGFPISQANSNARSGANYAGERRSEAVVANAKTNEAMMNGKGRRDLVSVFQWLRENHVRTIKRVVVIDDSDRPHSDDAIEQALMNLDVEIWDWKKPDICSDVIYSVAPNVREVSLYWSGNAATMLGWYSNEGFANREKFRKLQKILLYYDMGLESKQRVENQIKRFRERINHSEPAQLPNGKLTNGNLTNGNLTNGNLTNGNLTNGGPTHEPHQPDTENHQNPDGDYGMVERLPAPVQTSPTTETTTEITNITIIDAEDPGFRSFRSSFKTIGTKSSQNDNKWMQDIQPICKFIRSIKDSNEADDDKTVKIAIIDDGIDACLDRFDGKIVSGASFCSQNGLDDSTVPYFVSTSDQHGTIMAAFILRIFPRARLYVAKLDERSGGVHGKRHITARSAADAIEWAIRCNVDIISMSWTIEKSSKSSEEISGLTSALNNAKQKGILMLCAASDQGNSTHLFCFPAASHHCVRVGASTGTGERCDWVHKEDYDILLPGENVPLNLSLDRLPTEHSGSSVATAIASGLCGALLYLARYALDKNKWEALKLTESNEMLTMLRFLGSYGPANSKFPLADQLAFLRNKDAQRTRDKAEVDKRLKDFFKQFEEYSVKAKKG